MSLMERSAVRPITAVAWTSNSSTCPRDFSLVGEKPKSYNLTKSGHFPLFFSFFYLSAAESHIKAPKCCKPIIIL